MTTFLADGNVIIALTVVEHIHHDLAVGWFEVEAPDIATCPITEGTLLRFLIREGLTVADAMTVLDGYRAQSWHRFWPDAIPYQASDLVGVIGHRQVTDAYLVALARHHGCQVATLDKGIAALHGEHVHLITS